ncbi:hypothetical protein [Sandaracinobacter sp.]|uniref:hypothetical protein n=1 Tax=Sandaracinobacter sp. TaxID=2487581 RepID=UPI0035B18CD3
MLVRLSIAFLACCLAAPVMAQNLDDDVDQVEEYREDYGQDGPETEDEDLRTGPRPPWTFQLRFAGDWRTNRYLAESGAQPSVTIAPDISLWRSWRLGGLRLFTEFGAIAPTSLTDARLDSSALFGTFELEAGTPGEGLVPYVAWEPWRAYEGTFQSHLLTLHTFSAGVRRTSGPTFLDVYARRQEASIDIAERTSIGATAFHNIPLGRGVLNLRTEVEGRRFDWRPTGRERQLRTRLRVRAILPLSHAVDMQLTADLHRTDSNLPGQSFTNLIIGPTILARLGF